MNRSKSRDERGLVDSVELACYAPLLVLFVAAIIVAGRVVLARQSVEAAAADAARSASIARGAAEAHTAATRAALTSLANQSLSCAATTVDADVTGFSVPVGTRAAVHVQVTCDVRLADLSMPGIPGGPIRVQARMSSPLDTYRERR